MYRFKRSIPVSSDRQGYIYFRSRLYKELPEREQKKIVNLCLKTGRGDYYKPLFEFVTTDVGATAVCMRYCLSRSTLERIVRQYYIEFANSLGL